MYHATLDVGPRDRRGFLLVLRTARLPGTSSTVDDEIYDGAEVKFPHAVGLIGRVTR